MCAVGFEPNWEHEKTLEELEQRYKACGWPVGEDETRETLELNR